MVYAGGLLADVLKGTVNVIAFNAHSDCEDAIIFKHAYMLCYEGIVSKRLGSHYHSGRVVHWLKIRNSKSPAVRREREDWGAKRRAAGCRRK
jgi:ATP-dependent DNA ligase